MRGKTIVSLFMHCSALRGAIRYKYTHAILSAEDSRFRGSAVPKERRVSLVCRTAPT